MLFGTQACSLPSLSKDTDSLPKVDPQYSLMHLSSLFRWAGVDSQSIRLHPTGSIYTTNTGAAAFYLFLFKRKPKDERYTENPHLVLISFFQLLAPSTRIDLCISRPISFLESPYVALSRFDPVLQVKTHFLKNLPRSQ